MTETQNEYLKRINRVIGYIERNLDGDLGLVGLAGLAYFSEFHFHRIFSAVVGESLNAFVVRKRIERIAAILAVGTDEPLVELAYRYGFEHPSSFSRAFKKFYGVSPTEFKRNGVDRLRKIGIGVVSEEQFSTPHPSDHRCSFFSLARCHCKPLFVSESGSVKADL